ncbi:MAG TPA: hypothetical protein VFK71_00835 [Gaiellaceae bacterium]|nr:hypothetical protein [Gaiellaceae bacterium]
MRKAVLAAVVAAAALAGVVAAVVLSGGGGDKAAPPASTGPTAPGTTAATSVATTAPTMTGTTATTATTPSTGGLGASTAPVDTTHIDLPPPPTRHSRRTRTFLVGTVDDALAQDGRQFAQAQADLSRDAGFDAAVVSATWHRGQRRPPARLVHTLRNVGTAAGRARMKLAVVVWHGLGEDTPRGPAERADFAAYAAGVVKALPKLRFVIVGNEPNLSTFWRPQFGGGGRDVAARAYADLLARSYDAIKAERPSVRVLGGALSPRGADRPHGSRPTHSPTAFIRDLGAAYRASHRHRPLMDGFAFHPYMEASRFSPTGRHPENTTITIADYPKLVALLGEAFDGTAQPGQRLPIYYTEFGVQTRVPSQKRRFYVDLDSPARRDAVPFPVQGAYYRRALELAYCQPTVRGLFVFHTFDEPGLGGWQSGLYFADRTPKPSLPAFKRSVADLRNGGFPRCHR